MIYLFDTTFLYVLFDPSAPVPWDKERNKPVYRGRERIEHLVKILSEKKSKIVLPTPALAEFMLFAGENWGDYLSIIKKRAVFEIAGFNDSESIELVQYCRTFTGGLKTKIPSKSTWAKVKYDHQIAAIAKTHRVHTIYSDDCDLKTVASRLDIPCLGVGDLPLPPPAQMSLIEELPQVIPIESGRQNGIDEDPSMNSSMLDIIPNPMSTPAPSEPQARIQPPDNS